jgi:hypothetical protein
MSRPHFKLNCVLIDKVSHFVVTSPINGILERLQKKEGGSSMTLDQVTRVLNDLECSSTSANSEAFTFGKSFFLFLYPEVCCIHFMSILSDILLCLIIWRLECSITV